jgi:threonine/homoserine/homoserine lactone efflux protein
MSLTLYLAYVAACIVIVVVPGPTVTLIVLPLRPSSTSAMSARPAAGVDACAGGGNSAPFRRKRRRVKRGKR